MNHTSHATDRALNRITDAGLSGTKVLACADTIASKMPACASVAVLMTRLPEAIGTYGNVSNGNQVWCIIRGGKVVTLMLRREDQPATADRLRVDQVFELPVSK